MESLLITLVTGLGIVIVIFSLVSACIMPWVNFLRINELNKTIRQLTSILVKEGIYNPKSQSIRPSVPSAVTINTTERSKATELSELQNFDGEHLKGRLESDEKSVALKTPETDIRPKTEPQQWPTSKIGLEQKFGAHLPVWIGGIALALAGFFLVKYSIENKLLSPTMRVTLGAVFGIALLYCGKWVRSKTDFSNGVPIAQSLAGAGIAVLYVVSFASVGLYELVPTFVGFGLMAAVTATALILSLRHGPPVAMLGMVGGFLTPALLSTDGGSAFSLFIYLYFTVSGLMTVVRKTKWWWLSIPTILSSLLWVIVWLISSYHPGDSVWLGLFLIGISATIFISSRQQYEEDCGGTSAGIFKLTSILNYIALGGILFLMGLIAVKAGFGFMEWGLFGLLALGGIGLAYFNDKLYGFVPWISMTVTAVMLFTWQTHDHGLFSFTLAVFAAIYVGSGCLLMFKARFAILWAGLVGATSISYYLLAYYKLYTTTLFAEIPLFWGFAALVLAAGAVFVLSKIQKHFSDYEYKEQVYAICAVAATFFICLGLSIELERDFLSIAIAGEMLAIAWINSRVSIKALRPITAVLACIFALLLSSQIISVILSTLDSLIQATEYLQLSVLFVERPLVQLGVPAVMFIGSSYLLRQQQDSRLIRIFEIVAIALIAVMGYYFTRNSFHPDQNVVFIKEGFFERGVISNILFIYGLACLWVGKKLERMAFSWSGIVLCGVAVFRITYFDILVHNPMWDSQKIEGIVVFNSLLLVYAIPLVWTYLAGKALVGFGKEKWARSTGGFMLVLLFALMTTNVRYIFHGEYLNTGIASNAEIYTYSIVWLLLGIGLLFAGFKKQGKVLRYASLGIILLTVGKVFLYDASELEGLYRVFSFFGLGISLIGLSYFYTRFVFTKVKQ